MSWVRQGRGELNQKLYRGKLRMMAPVLRRRLAEAEVQLGLLGFQYGEECPAAMEAIAKIRSLEKEQVELVNQSATLGQRLSDYREQIEKLRAQHQEEIAELQEMLRPRKPRGRRSRSSQSDRQKVHQLNVSVAADAGLGGITPGQSRGSGKGAELELDDIEEQIRERLYAFEHSQRVVLEDMRSEQRQKQELEKRLTALEDSKRIPLREIGSALADSGIFPRNQPEALYRVQDLRDQLDMVSGRLKESPPISKSLERRDVFLFYVAVVAAIGAVAGFVSLLYFWTQASVF
jgi:DNA repair exonuclease SbcCD ATPase subunit